MTTSQMRSTVKSFFGFTRRSRLIEHVLFPYARVIPIYSREIFSAAFQRKEATMNRDHLCKLSRLCDGILPLVGSLGAFATLAIVLAVSV